MVTHNKFIHENPYEKTCSVCKKIKNISEFYKGKHCRKGVRGQCKSCTNKKKAVARKTWRDSQALVLTNNRYCVFFRFQEKTKARTFRKNNPKLAWARIYEIYSQPEMEYYTILEDTEDWVRIKSKPKTKICNACHKEKPADKFYKQTASSDGLQNWCSKCSRAHINAWNERTGYIKKYCRERVGKEINGKIVLVKLKNPKKDKCEICCSNYRLAFHHWNYVEEEKGLTLCGDCHQALHRFEYINITPSQWESKLNELIKQYKF